MMQSNKGDNANRNFELLLATPSSKPLDNNTTASSFMHLSRDGTFEKWSVVSHAQADSDGTDLPSIIGQPAIVGTSYNSGEFHAIARDSESTIQHWVLSNTTWTLSSAIKATAATGKIDGHPGVIQADDSSLAMVIRHSNGSLQEVRSSHNPTTFIPYRN